MIRFKKGDGLLLLLLLFFVGDELAAFLRSSSPFFGGGGRFESGDLASFVRLRAEGALARLAVIALVLVVLHWKPAVAEFDDEYPERDWYSVHCSSHGLPADVVDGSVIP